MKIKTILFSIIVMLTSSCALQPVTAQDQKPWSAALFYDAKSHQTSAIALYKITTFSHILGKGFSLDLDGFAGTSISGQGAIAGLLVGKRFPLADQVQGYLGFGATIQNAQPVSGGIAFGISLTLK